MYLTLCIDVVVKYYLMCIIISLVPFPVLSLTSINSPTLSEPLTLECQATVVRGITSRLDFTWMRVDDDSEVVLRTVVGANNTGDSLVYIDSYTTPFLNESDIGAMYFCIISINDGGLDILMDSSNFTLDIFSKDACNSYVYAIHRWVVFKMCHRLKIRGVLIS